MALNRCNRKTILQNLRRICGQVQGIEKMIEEDRDVAEVLQQVTAASSALRSVAKLLLQDYAADCFATSKRLNKKELEKLIEQLFKNM